jgi:hypothetical protein
VERMLAHLGPPHRHIDPIRGRDDARRHRVAAWLASCI